MARVDVFCLQKAELVSSSCNEHEQRQIWTLIGDCANMLKGETRSYEL